MTEFLIGCDPELFLEVDGKPLSAHGVIPGTKAKPHPVPSGAIQVDGLAVEFNTDPVRVDNFEAFNSNVVRVMKELYEEVRKTHPDARFKIEPVQDFGLDFIEAQPDEAKELGCDPDWNAYTLKPNPRPDGKVSFRTASGHLHVGWGADIPAEHEDHLKICSGFVKMLDATVGIFMTYIDRDPRRRELYGKAGAFRPKSYGVEYRTPSNVWLQEKSYRKCVFALLRYAISQMTSGRTVERVVGLTEAQVAETINNGDWRLADTLLEGIFCSEYSNHGTWRQVRNMMQQRERKAA